MSLFLLKQASDGGGWAIYLVVRHPKHASQLLCEKDTSLSHLVWKVSLSVLKYAYEFIFSLIVNEDFSSGLFLRKKSDGRKGHFFSRMICAFSWVVSRR
jgi:hypothetical protein